MLFSSDSHDYLLHSPTGYVLNERIEMLNKAPYFQFLQTLYLDRYQKLPPIYGIVDKMAYSVSLSNDGEFIYLFIIYRVRKVLQWIRS